VDSRGAGAPPPPARFAALPKARLDDLALFGGEPVFGETLHVGRPNLGDRAVFLARLEDALDRRWLTNAGRYEQELERRVSELTGVEHCVAVCNATVALDLLGRALGLTGEVVVPSFTFVASAHALLWQGLRPVFCDVDPRTHHLDPRAVESAIGPGTSAILAVHLWGRPCDVGALSAIARRHGLRLLFDAAHALGCSHRGAMIGGFGDAEVFSLHATKVVNAFEGGMIATNDGDLAARLRLMRNFGFADYDRVVCLGTNGKMSEASAAMGLTSLESLEEFVAGNHRNHRAYERGLEGVAGLELVRYDDRERCNWQYVVVEVDEQRAGLDRDGFLRVLQAENVAARRYFFPGVHRMEPYRTIDPDAGARVPNTERLVRRVLCLPTGTAVGEDDVAAVCGLLRFARDHAAEIRLRLAAASEAAAGESA
jgi:dTDP-4-amino-4,6-dideoxygalactose transaminase